MYKVLSESMVHNDFQYKLGLNVDTVPFNPSGSCEPGGLYFTSKDYIYKYFHYGKLIAKISIPEDAQIYQDPECDKWKADKIVIESIIPITYFESWLEKDFCYKAVKDNGRLLEYVPEFLKTVDLCMSAIKRNGYALKFVPEHLINHEMCLEAINQDGELLKFVPIREKTYELCLLAIKNRKDDISPFNFIPEEHKTRELCLLAIEDKSDNFKYVPNNMKTYDFCLEAAKLNYLVIDYIPEEFVDSIYNIIKKYLK